MSKMKYSGVEWIGDIPKNWSIDKLKYCINEVNSGGTPETSNMDYYDDINGIPWVAIGDMSTNEYVSNTSKKLTLEGIKSKNLKIYPSGTLLYSIFATIGKTSFLKIDATINQAILAIIPNKKIDKLYLKYQLNAMEEYVLSECSTNTQNNLNSTKVKNFNLVLPKLNEQKLIANFLGEKMGVIYGIITDLKKQIELLKKYEFSLITEKVSRGLNNKSDFMLGRLGLYSFVTKISGFEYTDVMADNLTDKGGIPIVRAQNVRMLKFDSNINEYIDEKTSYKLDRCSLNKKCLLLTFIGAGIGDICIFEEKERYHLAPNVAKIEISDNKKLMEKYVMYYFASEYGKNEIFNITKASAQPSLSMETIRRLKIFIPPIDEQKEIVDYLDKKCEQIDKIIEEKQKQIEKIEEYKKSVIYEYVTGKKRVEGAEELYG